MLDFPSFRQWDFVVVTNPACLTEKRLLDSELGNVVNKPASGLVRFSYKLSVFQIVGLVLCHPEATGV